MAKNRTGLPLSISLSGAQAHQSRYAETLLNRIESIRRSGHLKSRPKAVLADKGYSNRFLRYQLEIKMIKAIILFKSNEKASLDGHRRLDIRLYKKRNVVERCFAMLKENRRIATRSEKTARNYLSMLKLRLIRFFKRLLVKGYTLRDTP